MKNDDWTDNRIRKIEDTLGTLRSLIDEYNTKNVEESDKEIEDGDSMEIEQERIGKRKKEPSPIEDKEDIIKDSGGDNIRPKKRVSDLKLIRVYPSIELTRAAKKKKQRK